MPRARAVVEWIVDAAIASLPILVLVCAACAGSGDRHPAVLLITVDSLRADHLGYAGHERARTPVIDALAARGAVFTTAFSTTPEAVPSLASLHTGRYPSSHGLLTEFGPSLADDEETLAEVLASQGYRTCAVAGSVALHDKYGLDQGFGSYDGAFADTPRLSRIPDAGLAADRAADLALRCLEKWHREAFFLWVNFHDPHYFYRPPDPWLTDFAAAPYDGEVAFVDAQIARVLDKLRDYGIEENTIVVFAGTNGEGLGDGGEDYHGTTLSNATTRVPLIIVAPGFDPGSTIDRPVSLVDVAPTIAALLGVDPLRSAEGIALTTAADPARPVFMEAWMPERLFGWSGLRGVVSENWKYVEGTRGELYDLAHEGDGPIAAAATLAPVRERLAGHLRSREAALAAAALEASLREPPAAPELLADLETLGLSHVRPTTQSRDPRDHIAAANDALRGMRSAWRMRHGAAQEMFRAVLAADPDNYTGLLYTALLHLTRSDPQGARSGLEKALAAYPGAAEIYHQLGHAVLDETDEGLQRAGRLFALATRIDPMNEEALYDLACMQSLRGERDAALASLQSAVAQGFRDFEHMKTDADLEGVRGDPRFEAIAGKTDAPQPAAAP